MRQAEADVDMHIGMARQYMSEQMKEEILIIQRRVFDEANKSQNVIEKIQKLREMFQMYIPPAIECH